MDGALGRRLEVTLCHAALVNVPLWASLAICSRRISNPKFLTRASEMEEMCSFISYSIYLFSAKRNPHRPGTIVEVASVGPDQPCLLWKGLRVLGTGKQLEEAGQRPLPGIGECNNKHRV